MKYKILLVIVIVVGLFLRLHQLGTLPPGPEWDEASVGYNAYSIATTGRDEWGHLLPSIFEAFGDYKNPFYIYSTAIVIRFLGFNLTAVRLTAALAGTITILLIYGIAWELTRKKGISLIAAVLIALSPSAIFFSRIAGDGMILSATLILSGIYFELRYIRSRSLSFMMASHLFLLVSLFAYNLARVLSPLFIVVFTCVNVLTTQFKNRIGTLLFVGITTAVAGSIIFLQAQVGGASRISYVGIFGSAKSSVLDVNRLRQDENNSKRSHLLFNKATLYGITLLNNYAEHFGSDFLTSYHNQSVVYESFYPLMNLLIYPFYLYGIYIAFRGALTEKDKTKKYAYLLVITWIVLSPIPSAITEGAPSGKRFLGALGSHEILITLGIFSIYEHLRNKKKLFEAASIGLFILAGVVLMNITSSLTDFYKTYAFAHKSLYAGKENAIGSFVASHYDDYDVFIYSHQVTGFPYIYPVFDMQMPLKKFWSTRKSYKLEGWNYVSQVEKMYFPDRLNLDLFPTKMHDKKVALILNNQEFEDFKKTALYKNQKEIRLYGDGDVQIYLISLHL